MMIYLTDFLTAALLKKKSFFFYRESLENLQLLGSVSDGTSNFFVFWLRKTWNESTTWENTSQFLCGKRTKKVKKPTETLTVQTKKREPKYTQSAYEVIAFF